MDDSQVRKLIRDEVAQQLNVILNASAGTNDSQSETISALFPGSPDITGRPVMHPFGFVSRATQGTISVIAKVGAGIQNRMTLGHRDSKRPTLQEGESAIYSKGEFTARAENEKILVGQIAGYKVQITKTQILLGKGDTLEPAVMGTTAVDFFKALIELIVAHTHMGNLGIETTPPLNFADFTQLKAQELDNNHLLAEDGGRF